MTKRLDSPTRLRFSQTTEPGALECRDISASRFKKRKRRVKSITPGYVLLIGAFCLLFVTPISALPQVGGVKMLPQKNQTVEPHNSRLKQRREERRRLANPTTGETDQSGNLNNNLSFATQPGTTTADKDAVTRKSQPSTEPVLLIMGGLMIGFLGLAGTAVVGFVILKSVRAKQA